MLSFHNFLKIQTHLCTHSTSIENPQLLTAYSRTGIIVNALQNDENLLLI